MTIPIPSSKEAVDLTIGAKELKRLVLGAVEDLGRYGLEVTSESMAAVASLIVNSSKLGNRVDADDRDRLRAQLAEAVLMVEEELRDKLALRSRLGIAERERDELKTCGAYLSNIAWSVGFDHAWDDAGRAAAQKRRLEWDRIVSAISSPASTTTDREVGHG